MRKPVLRIVTCFLVFFLLQGIDALNKKTVQNISKGDTSASTSIAKAYHRRHRRQDYSPYYPDYPAPSDYYDDPGPYADYQGSRPNYLVPAGIAGGAGLALKAAKTKAKLKLLALPAGIALMAGLAALASRVIPPAAIGGITLPFQGKKRKRRAVHDYPLIASMVRGRASARNL